MTPGMLALTYPVPRATRRLMLGFAASVAAHLALLISFGPAATTYVPPLPAPPPLQVDIRREAAPQPAAEIAAEQPSELATDPATLATPLPMPQQELPPAPAARDAPIELNLPLDKYYTARELDVRAEPVNEVDLVYPKQAYAMRVRGIVILRIFINEHGAIDEVSVVKAAPPGMFEEAALTAARALQFSPAIKNGRNVKSQKTIEVVFDPYETISIP